MIHNIVQMSAEAQTASTTSLLTHRIMLIPKETHQYPTICVITSLQEQCDPYTPYQKNEPSQTIL
jgi:hypothetical protein